MTWVSCDTETTGLDARFHRPWEVAIVEPDGSWNEWRWRPNDDVMRNAEPEALAMNGFAERAPQAHVQAAEHTAAIGVAEALRDRVVVGSKPSFDTEMLTAWLRSWGIEPTWHHRPVCVATMAYGWLEGRVAEARAALADDDYIAQMPGSGLPWRSDDLSRACGVDPEAFDRHTALGDALWMRELLLKVTGGSA